VTLALGTNVVVADIHADEQRLRQVLINLVSNAIKYNRPGGTVTLSAVAAPGDRVRVIIADTGIGIAPERQEEIFVPFNRLGAEYTGIEGTGIGLALSKSLVEAMGGTIGFSSAPGRGSTFWIEFPAESATLAGTDAAAETLVLAPRAAAGGYSVLYIEDNPTNLRLVQHILSGLPNVTMHGAPAPQLGLDLARAHRPDVIVLDLNLPGMDGFEVLARLKGMPETSAIPVMALSAAALPTDLRKGKAAGFFRYLTKPIDVNAFIGAIDDALHANDGARSDTAAPG
jgi:CheY-like chemotaxis protein